jgi:hypothetical protein
VKRGRSYVICGAFNALSATKRAIHATIRHKNDLIFKKVKRCQKRAETPYKMVTYAFRSHVKRGRNDSGTERQVRDMRLETRESLLGALFELLSVGPYNYTFAFYRLIYAKSKQFQQVYSRRPPHCAGVRVD